MTFDLTHGAGGLWELYTWTPAVGPSIDLNEQDVASGVFVESTSGLHSVPEREIAATPKHGQIGEIPIITSPNGKTVGYNGEIRGATVADLRVVRTALVAAFADERVGVMQMIPHEDHPGPTAQFRARVLQLDPPDEQVSRQFWRKFTLSLRMDDPRFYYPSEAVTETGNPAVVTNPGSAPADPVITIAGASGTVNVTDGTHTLQLVNVPAGDLVLDFAARSAICDGMPCKINAPYSDWWDTGVRGIEAGATVSISQTGGTGVTVEFTPSTWA